MLRKTLNFFYSLYPFNLYEAKKAPEFVFSQNNVFRHACATPLTILMSNLEQNLSIDTAIKNNHQLLSSIEAVKKLHKIIGSVTQKENFQEEFEVISAINEVVGLLNCGPSEKGITKRILIDKQLLLFGNKLYFQEALTCLLNNSIEAYKGQEHKPISLIVRKIENNLKIDIVDYASGMNLIIQKLAFLNGVSTKKNGSGLGLYFAKGTIEKIFSGKMMVKSSVGFGTHVSWLIPLKKPYSQNPLQS